MSDNRFSNALFKAACIDFHFWYRSISEELNYAVRYMTDCNELLNEFDDAPLLHRQMFLQFAALSMRDEGL